MIEVYAHIYRFTNFGMREIHRHVTDDDFITLGEAKRLLHEADARAYQRGKEASNAETKS